VTGAGRISRPLVIHAGLHQALHLSRPAAFGDHLDDVEGMARDFFRSTPLILSLP
jgi:hypothetical protein